MKEKEYGMATLDWSECPLVEVIPGKVSGAPLLKNTRLPVEVSLATMTLSVRRGCPRMMPSPKLWIAIRR